MMIRPCLLVLATASLCAPAQAATTATLTITGTVTPSSCNVALTGADVDYGAMTRATVQGYALLENLAYTLPAKTVTLNVTCNNPIGIALNVSDNKSDSRAVLGNAASTIRYGLGLSGLAKVGAYGLEYSEMMLTLAAGSPRPIASHLKRPIASVGAWAPTTGVPKFNPEDYIAFHSVSIETVPSAIRAVSAKISVRPYLLKTTVDDAPGEIKLDGNATVTLQYI